MLFRSSFPVCHGEKGIYESNLISGNLGQSNIIELRGGVASNVVPDSAAAKLNLSAKELLLTAKKSDGISISEGGDSIVVNASGISAHAGTPYDGISAINRLLEFLLSAEVLNKKERDAAKFLTSISGDISGKNIGIDCDDKKFTPLTIVAGLIKKENDFWVMNLNSRYPTAITPETLEERIETAAANNGFSVGNMRNVPPFYLEPELPAIRVLSDIYNELTESDENPYVMSGGTYARKMQNAVAFGPKFPKRDYPEWVGSAHMKNEALNIDDAILSAEIYAEVLTRLQDVEF